MLDEIYTDLIAENSQCTYNRRKLVNSTIKERGRNSTCGDEINLELYIVDGFIKDAAFGGMGCAISQASTNMMINLIKGKSVNEAQQLADIFITMVKGKMVNSVDLERLDEAIALQNISTMPARIKCAILAWDTLIQCLNNYLKG